jgi:dynein heavy chain
MVAVLCNPGLRERHWAHMSTIVGQPLLPDAATTLQQLLDLELEPHMDALELVSGAASKEFSLEKAMDKMEADWAPMDFATVPFRDSGVHILSSVDDVQVRVEFFFCWCCE